MANTFLNKDGLSHLITKLKTYITSQISAHTNNKSNPHGVTKAQVGLGSVANLDQSKAIKSISRSGTTFTATALDGSTTTFTQQDNNTTYGSMSGASASAAGTSGLVPAPSAGAANRYLRSDGAWAVPPDTDTKYSAATSSAAGLMSAADKTELDWLKKNSHMVLKSTGREKTANVNCGDAKLRFMLASSAMSEGKPVTDGYILNFSWDLHNWESQLFIPSVENANIPMQFRYMNGDVWRDWIDIYSKNYPQTSTTKSFTLSASSWRNGSYTISDSLITASSNQEVLPAVGITAAQYNALSKAQIVDGGQAAGSLTLKALGTVPTIDIPIRVVFRGTI